ncbi:hypothetical protein ColLi_04857 [Colletotrichum liriopes]|uniref:Uncharacterized protein n=1 Tax=Colletotrichum liriopes TaxID=708192 RepID=A0AA37GJ94_9PEZI|nr:hypothetical protein ColLi_04857 [Colletotrichum liriopes]
METNRFGFWPSEGPLGLLSRWVPSSYRANTTPGRDTQPAWQPGPRREAKVGSGIITLRHGRNH